MNGGRGGTYSASHPETPSPIQTSITSARITSTVYRHAPPGSVSRRSRFSAGNRLEQPVDTFAPRIGAAWDGPVTDACVRSSYSWATIQGESYIFISADGTAVRRPSPLTQRPGV